MKISFITTVYNEEGTVTEFLDSLLTQSRLPDEIIIVDAESSDRTVAKIRAYFQKYVPVKQNLPGIDLKHPVRVFQFVYNGGKEITTTVIIKPGNRSIGRNEAIKRAKGDVIVCSDAGNILDKDWLRNITKPFEDKHLRGDRKSVDVVAGYYQGLAKSIFQRCVIPYALVMPDRVNETNFLPATRSIAFTKAIWKKVGMFDEQLSHNEDYVFARKLKSAGANIIFAKNALVYWMPRDSLKQSFVMMYRFAYGDAEANIIRPKVVLIFVRYSVAVILLVLTRTYAILPIIFFLLLLYLLWAIWKNYKYVKNWRAIFLLPALQLTADAAVLSGTTIGLLKRI